jgi:hypothetical protein
MNLGVRRDDQQFMTSFLSDVSSFRQSGFTFGDTIFFGKKEKGKIRFGEWRIEREGARPYLGSQKRTGK